MKSYTPAALQLFVNSFPILFIYAYICNRKTERKHNVPYVVFHNSVS